MNFVEAPMHTGPYGDGQAARDAEAFDAEHGARWDDIDPDYFDEPCEYGDEA
jgi:hypothetical protein